MSYQEFAEKMKLKYAKESGKQATFVPNKHLPVYNWFYYKEGFSRELVFDLIDKFRLNAESVVLDPFCGSGTTLLACKEKCIFSIGFDVLPIAVFASKVKTADYDAEELKQIAKKLMKIKFRAINYDYPVLMKRAFSKYALQDISLFRSAIVEIESKKLRDFFLLALINAAMKCSYAWKDGGVLKIRKHPVAPLRIMLRRIVYSMIRDVEHFEHASPDIVVENCDARMMRLEPGTIDAIITSPPYLNNIDYTNVYEIEQFVLHEEEKPALRSYIGLGKEMENNILPELDLPLPALAYFTDMFAVLKELFRVAKEKANIAIVVGNAYFPDEQRIVDSDLVLSYLAAKIGLSLGDIVVLNERFALEARTKKKGILRESLILLKK